MSKNLSLLFVLLAALYLFSMPTTLPFLWLLKILPIGVLVTVVLRSPRSAIQPWLLVALFFSACGDVLLAFDVFIYGVTAFLLTQIVYGVLFLRYWQGVKHRWPFCLLLIGYAILALTALLPNLDSLKIPVVAYLCVISGMGILAMQSSFKLRWTVLGALVFIISDSLIAVNKFITPLPFEGFLIMCTYYAAQYMLVTGFLKQTAK